MTVTIVNKPTRLRTTLHSTEVVDERVLLAHRHLNEHADGLKQLLVTVEDLKVFYGLDYAEERWQVNAGGRKSTHGHTSIW